MIPDADVCEFPADPLLSRAPFPQHAVLYPMGFPLEVETNSPEVLQALRKSWHLFPQQFAERPLRMSLVVLENQRPELPQAPVLRSRLHLLSIVSDPDNFVVGDFHSGSIFGWVTRKLVEDESFFRYHFLDVSVLTVLQQLHLAPLHAALVARNGQGVALCGNSCAGKSTMAYACARAGWTFVADDATYLLRSQPDCYAIGNSHVIHLREGAKLLFPELRDCATSARPNGKVGMEAFTCDLPISTAPGTPIQHVIFLNRNGSGLPKLGRCHKAKAMNWFARFAAWADDRTRQRQAEAYSRLANCSFWEFEYQDLGKAVSRLEDLIQTGR